MGVHSWHLEEKRGRVIAGQVICEVVTLGGNVGWAQTAIVVRLYEH